MAINTSRPRQNGQHFAQSTSIFLNENVLISISLKFVPKRPFNNISPLVQIIALRRPADTPLSEPRNDDPVHRRIYAALGGDELMIDIIIIYKISRLLMLLWLFARNTWGTTMWQIAANHKASPSSTTSHVLIKLHFHFPDVLAIGKQGKLF